MWPEILSIIAVCISGAAAVCSACVPAALNAKTKKADLALKRELEEEKLKREKEQEYEHKFEVFYQAHLKVVTDFSNCYVQWKNSLSEVAKTELVTYVSKLSMQFRGDVQKALLHFLDRVKSFNGNETLDVSYKNCLGLILNSFGVYLADGFPDILLSDILRGALKKQYPKLQDLKIDQFNRLVLS